MDESDISASPPRRKCRHRTHCFPSERLPVRIGRVALVPLSQGHFAIIDARDIDIVGEYVWHLKRDECGNKYAKTNTADGKHHYLHRLILGVTDPASKIDHKDGDGLNCRRRNLRAATTAQNNVNRRPPRRQHKGVYAHRRKWTAIISHAGERYYLGLFSTPDEAARAYNLRALELFGDFACPNRIRH